MRNSRISSSRSNPIQRPHNSRRLVGPRNPDLRIPNRLPPILEFQPHRNLQTVLPPSPPSPSHWQKSRIVSKPVHFPSEPYISPEAKDIILQFCTVDRSHRLGNISGGATRVKNHPFFKGVYWDDVYYRKYRGPIIPPVRYPGDTQCFDQYPDEKAGREVYNEELRAKWEDHFRDFWGGRSKCEERWGNGCGGRFEMEKE